LTSTWPRHSNRGDRASLRITLHVLEAAKLVSFLRVIGDVHAQIGHDDVVRRHGRSYREIIAGAEHSVQIGDMGDDEAYRSLVEHVDPARHRFFGGNHEHYVALPPHALGDFGAVALGGVEFFFVRGAASTDKTQLLDMGRQVGKTLWYEQEELTDAQMDAAEQAYLAARPTVMLSHDAPTEMARMVWAHGMRLGPPNPEAAYRPSRTCEFLARLWKQHAPRLWAFGHYHRDWNDQEGATLFRCVGELSWIDVSPSAEILSAAPARR
jgi:hypothetical protein